ncbi:MAG: hypothetical protein IJX65_09960 [Alistipes sp.]|nr:hypothetical protein [Alistipes sp.]
MKRKTTIYVAPLVKAVEVTTELGFANTGYYDDSFPGGWEDEEDLK